MIWKIETNACTPGESLPETAERYWMKDDGEAVTLLLDCGDGLRGWRVPTLEGACFAEELDHVKAFPSGAPTGTFAWERFAPGEAHILLDDGQRALRLRARAIEALPPGVHGALTELVTETRLPPERLADLVRDGVTARMRVVERFCGLGRELDGDAFDAPVWRKALEGLSLDEIHTQLRALEVRFDLKHPPVPLSEPEPLEGEGDSGTRQASALRIVRG